MNGKFLLGLDQGTTGATAIVFDLKGGVVGKGYQEFQQYYPHPGWVEHDADEIWSVTLAVVKEALLNARIEAKELLGVGITNQRETTVIWDRKSGKPISRAIVWQCRRTADICEGLKRLGAETSVREKTGLVLDPYFSATKIAWLLDHIDGARARAERGELAFGTIDSWLLWNLTNGAVHATDFTNASRTLLFNIQTKKWDDDLLKLFRVPSSLLPEVRDSAGDFGSIDPKHFGAPVAIRGIAGDQQAALFGHFATNPGRAKCTFGTGAFAIAYLGDRAVSSKNGLLTTLVCNALGKPAYGLEGSIFMAGAVIQWLRDGLKILKSAGESESIATSVPSTGGVVLVPAFVGLGAPYWDSEARGAILGMTRGTTQAHIVRAGLESIAYQTSDLMDAMAADTHAPLLELNVDGGATANDFLTQFLADILAIPVVCPKMIEMTAYGAARLAATAIGLDQEAWRPEKGGKKSFPAMPTDMRRMLKTEWKSAVARVRSTRAP